ncbi:hypothetical protein WA026_005812 [Henosepilachna vigintioctopunctata]|uniref:Uncharacterized protein n=1 Tax=Henosepilachna vigintioctopunctata TaxID=420089 RepID=A0AAW1U4A6_9CUCU
MSDHNFPRRRDSGNWSGDRNSASSASSTTMDNPYLYLIGKVPPGNVPESPTLVKSDSSSAGSAIYDAGYDSYSLSSNDSSTMTTLQHMMKIGHLAKIPEDYNNLPNQVTQSCDILCDEADKLLVKSRQLEDDHDLVLALALCNAAATKARAAMNAPYNNPQTLTLARMKHNTCIMRARSLHRRMTQTASNKDTAPPEIRHTREGSSGSGRHSRQSSRDKGQHSRQNSKELLTNIPPTEKVVSKNIEIYATLPKRKDLLKNRIDNISLEEPVEYVSNDKQPPKESRGFFSRSKQKDNAKREKRSRSEDRSKRVVEFTLTPEIIEIKPKLKEEKTEKQEKDGKSKKQHKIRRKLLMGGLIKRKNRSMPDLTDANPEMEATIPQPQLSSVDDSKVGLKGNVDNTQPSMSGYLSEGHLEFNANNTNPNLKKSKLMRKSFYASAGKILSVPKVPPPPPLRTTSQLTTSKPQLNGDEIKDSRSEYQNLYELSNSIKGNTSIIEMLRYEQSQQRSLNESNNSNNSFNSSICSYNNQPVTLITTADVHRESRGSIEHLNASSVDEVDCRPSRTHLQTLELPPYPSPAGSTVHSRQASEEFPPPPPPLDLSALDEHLPQCATSKAPSSSLLGQLQNKREQIFSFESSQPVLEPTSITSGGNTWLRELQAKQAALKVKRINSFNKKDEGVDVVNTQKFNSNDIGLKASSVKDLTSKFEVKKPEISDCISAASPVSFEDKNCTRVQSVIPKKQDIETIAPEQIAEEIREVERINASLQETLNYNKQSAVEERKKHKLGKKKSVSFCDQVILVATAEDQEDDSYIPNPILERVLRSAINKPENNDGDIKTSEDVVKAPQDSHPSNNNFTHNSVEEQKSSSENLFDITMRNTMENSKIMNPNLITKIANTEPPKSTVPQQSTYSSVAFAQNRNLQPNNPPTNVPPSQPLYSVNQYSQYPNNVPQQSQLQGFSHSEGYTGLENNPSAMPYNHFAQHSPSAIQQPMYQQQPIYSGNSSPQYSQYSGHNNSQQGYGYASQPIHPQQQQNQQYYHPTQNAHYGGHYQQKANHYAPVASYPQHHVTSPPAQNMYSSTPHAYPPQPNYQKSYGKEGQPRQPQNTLQQNYGGQNAKMNYQYPPQPLKGHNQVSRTSGLYQSVPFSSKPNPHPVYQRIPTSECNMNQNQVAYNPYQRLPSKVAEPEPQKLYDVYHRVPSHTVIEMHTSSYHQT